MVEWTQWRPRKIGSPKGIRGRSPSSLLIQAEIKHKVRLKAGDVSDLAHFMEAYKVPTGYLVSVGELDSRGPIKKVDCFNVGRLAGRT